jgi:DNA-directed RNA polymerase specialized sigma24 family protein
MRSIRRSKPCRMPTGQPSCLRDVEGLSTQEAAEVLNISESALKVRLMRARMALRESLTGYFADKMQSKVV